MAEGKRRKVVSSSARVAGKAGAKRSLARSSGRRKVVSESSDRRSASERIDRWIAELDDWRGARLAEIRELIHEVDPGAVEEWKWMGSPVWSHQGMYVLANAHKDKVKLTFPHGAHLRDPKRLFNAGLGGNKWRAIDYREGDEIDRPALRTLLREAVDHNTRH